MPIMTHMRTPLNRMTFKVPKIRGWVEAAVEGKVLNLFAGGTRLDCDEIRNDIRPDMPADYHMDALELLKQLDKSSFNTILLDPPYSHRKSMEMYEGKKMSPFNAMKPYIEKVLTKTGIVITFGYHSVIMGKKRGFKVERVCVMSHGGAIHDTIATVERRVSVT